MATEVKFGRRLRELRLERKLSQRELADRIAAKLRQEDRRGFDFTYLSKIENGRLPPPSVPAILQLAGELGTDPDDLLALAGKVPPDLAKIIKKSEGARSFFRSAFDKDLSEDDWRRLLKEIENK